MIAILCAGPGLGFYIPGVIMQRQLAGEGWEAQVWVFESLLRRDKKENVPKAKISFHRDFSFALMGQHLAKDPSPYLDPTRVEELLAGWQKENRRHFVIFSGFWIPLIERYAALPGVTGLDIQLCHVDAASSTSWNLFDTGGPLYQHVWFNNWEHTSISYHIDIAGMEPLAFDRRADSYLIHGGGWGMGTYQGKIAGLNAAGLRLSVIAYEKKDLAAPSPLNQYYMLDPAWNTWDLDEQGQHQFPPFGKVGDDDHIDYVFNPSYPEVYNILRTQKGIISKPGAGTLMDSLSSATPLLFLEPFGDYERKNAQLWEHFGLGVSLKDWMDAGCSEEILERLHNNLRTVRAGTPDYITTYIKNYCCLTKKHSVL